MDMQTAIKVARDIAYDSGRKTFVHREIGTSTYGVYFDAEYATKELIGVVSQATGEFIYKRK
jgi:hypothetical protein